MTARKHISARLGRSTKGFRSGLEGMLSLRDMFIEAQKSMVSHYAIRLADGDITVQDWYRSMIGVLKQAYMAEFALSKGGLRNMTSKNWETLTLAVTDQVRVFTAFAQNVSLGKTTLEEIIDRAGVYLSGSVTVF